MSNVIPEPAAQWKQSESFPRIAVPRPELDVEQLVPDLHEALRWPLTAMSHPELSPRFEIANVFAQPGIGWLDLCERGVQNRMTAGRNLDELDYLRGWCSAIKGDADTACGKLVPLTHSAVFGMPDAVRIDVANILANTGGVDTADHLIAKHRIDDIEILDTLAATYVELGMERDAFEVNRRALDSIGHTTTPVQCRRLVKDLVLGGEGGWTAGLRQLDDIVTNSKVPDPTCVALTREVKCWIGPAENCDEYFRAVSIDPRNTYLLAAYRAWPRGDGSAHDWGRVTSEAVKAHDLPGAKELAWLSLEAAIKAAPACDPGLMTLMRGYLRNWPMPQLRDEMQRCHWDP